jgi:putative peptidoglycan lipid II flippase
MSPREVSSRSIFRNTVTITALSFLGILVNLANSQVSAFFYGATPARDAYLLAIVVPNYLSSVVSGILSFVFIPIFIDYHIKDAQRAWRIASSLINLVTVAMVLVALAGFCWPLRLVGLLAPGYGVAEAQTAAHLLRILLPSVIFTSLVGVFCSLSYAEHRFVLPALATIVATLVTLLVNITLNHALGIKSLAFGFTCGSAISMLILLPGMLRQGRWTFSLNLRDEGLHRMFRASLPLCLASLLYRFNTGFERMLASHLPAGSISFMGYATQIAMVLSTLTSGGIATTVFPLISRTWAEKDMVATRKYFALGIRTILLVSLPIAAAAVVLGSTFVALLLERGAFQHEATAAVTQCLVLLMGSYIFGSLGNVVAKGFYVAQKTTFLAVYNILETTFYVGLAWFLSRLLSYRGLALAASLRNTFSLCLYIFLVRRIFQGINGRALLRDSFKISAASLVLLLVFFLLNHWLAGIVDGIALLALAAAVGGVLYFLLTIHVFQIKDAVELLVKLKASMTFARFLKSNYEK